MGVTRITKALCCLVAAVLVTQAVAVPVFDPGGWAQVAWSTQLTTSLHSTPTIYDLDGNGVKDILVRTDDGYIYALRGGDGSQLWKIKDLGTLSGYDFETIFDMGGGAIGIAISSGMDMYIIRGIDGGEFRSWSLGKYVGPSSVGDVDGDGGIELVFGTMSTPPGNYLFVYDPFTGLQEWNYSVNNWVLGAPNLVDADNDGETEIIFTSPPVASGSLATVYCIDGATGSQEWNFTLGAYRSLMAGVTTADADQDGMIEVIFGDFPQVGLPHIYCLNGANGSVEWTYDTWGGFKANPVIGDVDQDGNLDIIAPAMGAIYCLDGNGNKKWERQTISGSATETPALADIDADPYLEVIHAVTARSILRVLDGNTGVEEYRVTFDEGRPAGSPAVGDVNNDGRLEIMFASTDDHLYAMRTDGTQGRWLTHASDFRQSGVYGTDHWDRDPDIALSRYNWTFGNVSRGANLDSTVQIYNYGPTTLTGSIGSSGAVIISDSPFSLLTGQSVIVPVSIDTSAQGPLVGSIDIDCNDPDEPVLRVPISGYVTVPQHDVGVTNINIPDIVAPKYELVNVTFANLGSFHESDVTADLTVDGAPLVPIGGSNIASLDPGEEAIASFFWYPLVEGSYELNASVRRVNETEDMSNNVQIRTIEVRWPIAIDEIAVLDDSFDPQSVFTEGDTVLVRVNLTNQWAVERSFVVQVAISEGATWAYAFYSFPTLGPLESTSLLFGVLLSHDITVLTVYNVKVITYAEWKVMGDALSDPDALATFAVLPS